MGYSLSLMAFISCLVNSNLYGWSVIIVSPSFTSLRMMWFCGETSCRLSMSAMISFVQSSSIPVPFFLCFTLIIAPLSRPDASGAVTNLHHILSSSNRFAIFLYLSIVGFSFVQTLIQCLMLLIKSPSF